jgi:hypothetical protein
MTRQSFASSNYIQVHTLPGPARSIIGSAETVNTDFFVHFLAPPGSYEKRSFSGLLLTNVHEKMREMSLFWLATHCILQWGVKNKISIYIVNMNFSKFRTF